MKSHNILIALLLLFFHYAFQSVEAGEPKKMLEPKIAGTWKVAEVYKEEANGKLTPYDTSGLDWSLASETILPTGLEVNFRSEKDAASQEALSIMELRTLADKTLCKHISFGYSPQDCDKFPDVIIKEFTLGFEKDPEEVELFNPVGAGKRSIFYTVRLNGKEWFGQFYVSNDNKSMWSNVYLQETKDGKVVPGTDSGGFQKWVRLK